MLLPGSLSRPALLLAQYRAAVDPSRSLLEPLPPFGFWCRHDLPRVGVLPQPSATGDHGLSLLLLLPIVGIPLSGSRVQAGITIAAVVVGSVVVSLVADVSITATVSRAALYFGMSAVISIAIIGLRDPLVRSRERARILLKDAQAINDMARRFAVLTEPASIKRLAAELAATVGSPPGSSWRRGAFLGIDDEDASVDSQFDQFDDTEAAIDVRWPSVDDPLVEKPYALERSSRESSTQQ